MTEQEKALRQEIAGIESLMIKFEKEDTLEGRVNVIGIAVMCLLNCERDRAIAELRDAKLHTGIIIEGGNA